MHFLDLLLFANQNAATHFFWDNPLFAQNNWERIARFLRLSLTFGGAVWLIWEARARRLNQPVTKAVSRGVAITLTLVAFLTYFDFFNPKVRYSEFYHRHELFHYYLGAKYFEEIGYEKIYECTAVAEIELGRGNEVRGRQLRDLRVNLIKPVSETYVLSNPSECTSAFPAEKWEAFKKDVDWFYNSSRGSYWTNMQKDHGYNPPPVWTMEGKFFAAMGDAGDVFFKWLSSIDVLLNLGMLLVIGWGFGLRVMMVTALFWGANGPANFYWTGGAFLRQDWVFLLLASAAFARKRKFFLAGYAMIWSGLIRVFPMFMLLGWLIIVGFELLRRLRGQHDPSADPPDPKLPDWARLAAIPFFALALYLGFTAFQNREDFGRLTLAIHAALALLAAAFGLAIAKDWRPRWLHPDHRRLVAGALAAGLTLVPLSMEAAGPTSYEQFAHHIAVHKNTPLTNTMGLKTIEVHTWKGRMHFARNDQLTDPFEEWKAGRASREDAWRPVHLALLGLIGLWTLWALRRTKLLWVGIPLGLMMAMSATNLTCYYYSMFLVGALLMEVRPAFGPAFLIASAASEIVLSKYFWIDDKYVAMSWLYLVLSGMMLFVYSRPFSLERLRRWWNKEPENPPLASRDPKAPPTGITLGP